MKEIKIHDKSFEIYITDTEIVEIVNAVANSINHSGLENPLFIAVLNGSFLFAADIMRQITIPNSEISFIKLSSYNGTESSGKVDELIGLNQNIRGRNIIILEDIIDTGNTLSKLSKILEEKEIRSIKVATLLFKPDTYEKTIPIDYIGRKISNKFVVGFGLDYNEIGRNLPHIYKLKTK